LAKAIASTNIFPGIHIVIEKKRYSIPARSVADDAPFRFQEIPKANDLAVFFL
jgi:hypothetical protein